MGRQDLGLARHSGLTGGGSPGCRRCGPAVYLLAYGHAPEPSALFDYARAYAGGFGTIAINVQGDVWGLMAVYALAVTSCVRAARRLGPFGFSSGALAATLALWCVATYFVSRSHDNNILNIMPFVAMGVAAILQLVDRAGSGAFGGSPLTYAALPIVWAILFIGYHQAPLLGHHEKQWFHARSELPAGDHVAGHPANGSWIKAATDATNPF